ncbi:hypothetical protein Agub_g15925, partial [Astrephomene gubernaculifera]
VATPAGGCMAGPPGWVCWALLPCTCCPQHQHRQQQVEEEAGFRSPSALPSASGAVDRVGEVSREPASQPAAGHAPHAAPPRHWHVVRCVSYVPGRMLAEVEQLTPTLLTSLGAL